MDISQQLQQQVIDAAGNRQALQIVGNNSKAFYGCINPDKNTLPLNVAGHRGIIDYQPSELTLTARAGTPLSEINELLSEHRQMLPFEAPDFDDRATLGGCIASGLSGPRRPWTGSVRDYLIGVRLLTGDGRDIRSGGRVMKNVAGYDLFRPMAGALGTLGVLLDITVKLLPMPERELSLRMETDSTDMQALLHDWTYASLPLSATNYHGNMLSIRLSGSTAAIDQAVSKVPSAMQDLPDDYWHRLNRHSLPFFDDSNKQPLYRLVVPGSSPANLIDGDSMIDWAGGQHWLKTSDTFVQLQKQAAAIGGSVSIFRNGPPGVEVFMPLPEPLLELHKRIKQVMDPVGILNPGRLYGDL